MRAPRSAAVGGILIAAVALAACSSGPSATKAQKAAVSGILSTSTTAPGNSGDTGVTGNTGAVGTTTTQAPSGVAATTTTAAVQTAPKVTDAPRTTTTRAPRTTTTEPPATCYNLAGSSTCYTANEGCSASQLNAIAVGSRNAEVRCTNMSGTLEWVQLTNRCYRATSTGGKCDDWNTKCSVLSETATDQYGDTLVCQQIDATDDAWRTGVQG